MSASKFASLTAGLLVRKGDAGPSSIALPAAAAVANTIQPCEPPSLAQLLRGNAPPLQSAPELVHAAMAAAHAASAVAHAPPMLKIVPPASAEPPPAPTASAPASAARENHGHDFRCEAHKRPACAAASLVTAGGTPPPQAPAKPRRIVATVTAAEFDTLGLMAVKKGTTRNQLLRNALDEYMALLADEYGGDCQCINTGCPCE